MNPPEPSVIRLWTDGSCKRGKPIGSWAFIAEADGERLREEAGRVEITTVNRMELTAAIQGLRWAKRFFPRTRHRVISDSRYVIDGATRHLAVWEANGWRYPAGMFGTDFAACALANDDLWRKLNELLGTDVRPDFEWVKGHNGTPLNEDAHHLAKRAIAELRIMRDYRPRN